MGFPKYSAFQQAEDGPTVPVRISKPVIHSGPQTEVSVPLEVLGRWYDNINEQVMIERVESSSKSNDPDALEDLRNEIYSYLRG